MREKKNKAKLILIIGFLIIVALAIIYKSDKAELVERKVDEKTKIMVLDNIIYFEAFNEDNFTCTGLTFDAVDEFFWIADYGAMNSASTPEPRLIEVDKQWTGVRNVISLKNIVESTANIQGVCYDSSNDSLWVATGSKAINVAKDGQVLSSFELGSYAKYRSNGIAYNQADDSLWILCYEKYLLNYDKHGSLLSKIKVNLQDQDQIWMLNEIEIVATVGADYNGGNNFVVKINTNDGKVDVLYRLADSYAVEGVCVLDNKLYIANDGLYHDAKIKKSYISVYNLD